MTRVHVESAGVFLPGLETWHEARAVLRGEAPYAARPLPVPAIERLAAGERRRATPVIKLAFHAAEQALAASARDPATLAAVFGSSDGDTQILNRSCQALAVEPRQLSPTEFHNSVHNAPAGYWSIATGSRRGSSTIAAYDDSFAAALLEAALLAQDEDEAAVLLCVYDAPHLPPMDAKRPVPHAGAVSLLLTARPQGATLGALALSPAVAAASALDGALENLRTSHPAARALPLLRLLARAEPGTVQIGGIQLDARP